MTSKTIKSLQDIPQFPRTQANYSVEWRSLERWLSSVSSGRGAAALDLDPDFQRGHVWSEQKQREYIEYRLKGGSAAKTLYFNGAGWLNTVTTVDHDVYDKLILVDGKQRLEAARKFLRSELRVFGLLYNEFTGTLRLDHEFIVSIAELETRIDVLDWYLSLNSGGVVHTDSELERVHALRHEELKKHARQ